MKLSPLTPLNIASKILLCFASLEWSIAKIYFVFGGRSVILNTN
jgi:hypothetical protein